MGDIAILTGGTLIKGDLGTSFGQIDQSVIGHAAEVTVDKDTCTIIGDGSHHDAINARVRQISTLLQSADTEYERNKLRERIARLTAGMAIILVGAQTETELKEKMFRVEDALCATRAAVEEGIVAGGGCTLIKLSKESEMIKDTLDNDEQR